MPKPTNQSCGNCSFIDFAGPVAFYGHQVTLDGVQVGYCRVAQPFPSQRPASQPASYPSERTAYVLGVEWPEVKATDWCGHWTGALTQPTESPETSA
jgi:hypothetical protein